MKKQTKLIYIKKSLFIFIVFVLFLGFATPALADYLGPDRTVTQATSVCKMILTECMYVAAKDEYRYHVVEDWSCSNESKPWHAYENFYGDCESWNNGHTQWGKEEQVKTVTTTLPEATINSELQDCTMQNGWCVTAPQLLLTANEPLSSYQIIIVEGTRNSESFACNGPTCTVQLKEGSNDFNYWALSTWGDSSQMGTTSAKVDTASPDINLQISGSLGTGGWYTSNATLSASAADATSGLATLEASEDNVIWNAYTAPLTFTDGVYTPVFRAADNAGNISNATTTISVDSITPSLVLSTSGSRGNNKWYLSNAKITAAASDVTSGVKSIYASADGGPWMDASSLTFSNGIHSYKFKTVDNAGNATETSEQIVMVDTIPPAIALTEELNLGESFEYNLQDDGSGLYIVRVVIEDEDERFPKVAWEERIAGNKFKSEFVWDGKFRDGTSAPIGEYIITVKVSDIAGNETVGYGIVKVNPLSYFQSIPVFTLPTETPLTVKGSQSELDPQQIFGGDTIPLNNPSTQILNITGSVAGIPENTSSSNVLWGAMALALIGTATSFALEEKKKREEAEAKQIAQVKAEVEAFNEAQEANRIAMIAQMKIENWKHGQEVLNDLIDKAIKSGASDEEINALKETSATQGVDLAIVNAQSLNQSLQQAGLAAYYNGMRQGEAEAAQKVALAEQQAGLMAYYEGMRAGEAEAAKATTTEAETSWWDNVWSKAVNWVDSHQSLASILTGVVVALATVAIVATAPLTLSALAIGTLAAIAVTAAIVTAGTIALNYSNDRPLITNLISNVLLGGFATQAFVAAGNAIAGACASSPTAMTACVQIGPIVDTLEQGALATQLTIQEALGDQEGAAQTYIEYQLELADGGSPGNTVATEIGEQIAKLGDEAIDLVTIYGDDIIPLLLKYGDDAVNIIGAYGDEGIELLQKGSLAVDDWVKYVPENFQTQVASGFDGDPIAITLNEDISVYRYWSDITKENGRWTTLDPNLSPEEVRALLALPNDNYAYGVTQFIVPQNTTVLVGKVAEQTSAEWSGVYAIGGGFQIYIPDNSVLIHVPLLAP